MKSIKFIIERKSSFYIMKILCRSAVRKYPCENRFCGFSRSAEISDENFLLHCIIFPARNLLVGLGEVNLRIEMMKETGSAPLMKPCKNFLASTSSESIVKLNLTHRWKAKYSYVIKLLLFNLQKRI